MKEMELLKTVKLTEILKVVILTDSTGEGGFALKRTRKIVEDFLQEATFPYELVCKVMSETDYFAVRQAVYSAHIIILCEVGIESSAVNLTLHSRKVFGIVRPKKIILITETTFDDAWERLYFQGVDFISAPAYREENFQRILLVTVLAISLQIEPENELIPEE